MQKIIQSPLLVRHLRRTRTLLRAGALAAILSYTVINKVQAAGLVASDGANLDQFGVAVSQSGSIGLIGAHQDSISAIQGSAYIFRNLDTATGTITQNVKLIASDGGFQDWFGIAVSQSGNIGLIGARLDDIGANNEQGSAYIFRNLDTATGTITQNAKLIASDGGVNNQFGNSVSQSGGSGLVGAFQAQIGTNTQGAAYLFRNLDTATGTITQNAKLIASDGAAGDRFGETVSLYGNSGLAGASGYDFGTNNNQGSAYLFHNLDTATGLITQNVKLIASDGAANDQFGFALSLYANCGLIGAYSANIGANSNQGSAYAYCNLNTAMGMITENVKLIASDGEANDLFGFSVSLSGNNGLVSSRSDTIGNNGGQGSAYIFRKLDSATGTITENVKLISSDGVAGDNFGYSVALDDDLFVIGANRKNTSRGKAYTGSVNSVTTLDVGNASRTISQISFISRDDWIVGQTTDANQVTLSAGDTATVTVSGKRVLIGQNAGSDNNRLIINGTLNAVQIAIGAAGNTGNVLQIGNGGTTGVLSTNSVITNHGSLIFNRSVATTQGTHFGSAAITGTGSLVKSGAGTLTLNVANTFTGDTVIKAGTLTLTGNGGLASQNYIVGDAGSSGTRLDVTTKTGGLTLNSSQRLSGIGQIDGNVQFQGTHSPGNSPGLQTLNGNFNYNTSSQLNWELAANLSTDILAERGTIFDGINVIGSGVLTIQNGVTSNLIFNAPGSTVNWSNPFWDSDHNWLVYDNTNAPTLLSPTIFSMINVSTDSLGATLTDGSFHWSTVGNDVYLYYSAVVIPEPSTFVLGALSFLGLSVFANKNRHRK